MTRASFMDCECADRWYKVGRMPVVRVSVSLRIVRDNVHRQKGHKRRERRCCKGHVRGRGGAGDERDGRGSDCRPPRPGLAGIPRLHSPLTVRTLHPSLGGKTL